MKKRYIGTFMALAMILMVLTGCGKSEPAKSEAAPAAPEEKVVVAAPEAAAQVEETFTYNDSVSQLATNWNIHTMQTADDDYPRQFLTNGFYSFVYNDELHPIEGKEPYEGYVIVPEMAASEPVDVTDRIKAEHPEFGIPESVHSGYAYTIDLNPNAVFDNGKKITAETWVESMKRLLDPRLLNYRASDFYKQQMQIAGAEEYANQGQTRTITLSEAMVKVGADTLEEYLAEYGDTQEGAINWAFSAGAEYDLANYPATDAISEDDAAWLPAEDEVKSTGLNLNELYDFYVRMNVALGIAEDNARAWASDELYVNWTYEDNIDYSTVGCFASGEYQLTLVFDKALSGFQLLYHLGSSWLVDPELYDACLKETNGVWSSTYCTSVDTTVSYGPYSLVFYQADKAMKFAKNDSWYGWTDGQHTYIDPNDGEEYQMYQTTNIDTLKVEEASTRKLMFLKGELMTYGLQSEDFAQYRNSNYCYIDPQETLFFFILNGHEEAITNRENAKDFDKSTTDLETMLLTSFRKGLALTYDKDLFATTVSPARSAGYGIIGSTYIYDPETGARYRDTDQAKKVLCDFYSVDIDAYPTLDDAVDSITGYDPETARKFYTEAFNEALELGYITDSNNDGISDQIVTIEYCLSNDSTFMTTTIDYLNEKMNDVTKGTPFEGKVKFVKSAPYGNEWTQEIKSGLSDTVLGGWTGALLNPFSLTELYTDPSYAYDAAWFDATSVKLTLNVPVDGVDTDLTMSLKKWSDALNGDTVKVDGVEYNFGEGFADIETRLDILAGIEGAVLNTYNYIPMLQDSSMSLLSQKAYYVVEDFNPILGRGGIPYLKYNYNDAEWKEYVASQGGTLTY